MVFAGMLPWYLFSSGLTGAAESMVTNANLIGKVYFPRMIVPAVSIVTALIDFLVSMLILTAVMIWYSFVPGWQILLLPMFIALALVASLGPGLWIAALNLKYRDFRFVVPFLVQLGLYVSPVGFSSAIIPERWRFLYSLNPMVGIIDGFRWCVLGGESPLYWPGFVLSLAIVACFLWLGIRTFRKTEKSFADLI
jgi:lipopolysaccharide transport system permease protein